MLKKIFHGVCYNGKSVTKVSLPVRFCINCCMCTKYFDQMHFFLFVNSVTVENKVIGIPYCMEALNQDNQQFQNKLE